MGSSFIILCMREYMMADYLQLNIVSITLHSMYKMTEIYKFQSRNLKYLVNDVFCVKTLLLE